MPQPELEPDFWQMYRTMLYRFALARVNDPDTAEDIVQDALIKVYEHLPTLQNREKIVPWMYQITRNVLIDYYRKQKPTEAIETVILAETMEMKEGVEKELGRCLLPMVHQLPPHYQQAIKMAEFEGLSQQAIADRQGLSLSGAKSRVQRGRRLLKKMLIECCPIELDHQGRVYNYECGPGCKGC